ncbi:DegT/DnrJ/EryC1/StrS family aminotransferase [Pseudomonas sp. R5-89-07]|uniref:DegT/DnrJ/EryC1/StrS family aminotransferase n=1 Tax=Pseudomonas sp. R5-89-07 TaxID=658644 RepID=UPI002114EAC2|nr:DegT/DnrJ/EryC1/StrS family aminotransferase [Pseudomonas sp. R5-89-07]
MQVAPSTADGQWRAREADRLPCSSWLAQFYARRHAALVGSGTAALELALRQLGVTTEWRVAVPAATCHQVVAAVLNTGAVPVIIENGAELLLSSAALGCHKNSLDAVIAVINTVCLATFRPCGDNWGRRCQSSKTALAPGTSIDLAHHGW